MSAGMLASSFGVFDDDMEEVVAVELETSENRWPIYNNHFFGVSRVILNSPKTAFT